MKLLRLCACGASLFALATFGLHAETTATTTASQKACGAATSAACNTEKPTCAPKADCACGCSKAGCEQAKGCCPKVPKASQ